MKKYRNSEAENTKDYNLRNIEPFHRALSL